MSVPENSREDLFKPVILKAELVKIQIQKRRFLARLNNAVLKEIHRSVVIY